MKTVKLLSIVLMTAVSVQAVAQNAPPPLSPVEYLDPDDVRTTPPASRPATPPTAQPAPAQPAAPRPAVPPTTTTTTPAAPRPATPPVTTVPAPPAPRPSGPVIVSNPVVQPIPPRETETRPTSRPAQPPPVFQPSQPSVRPSTPPPPVYRPNPADERMSSLRGFRIGDVVATDRYYVGQIQMLFRNESADVRFQDGTTANWPLSRLMKTEQELKGFTVGQVVVNDRHFRGQIVMIFADGVASVRFTDGSTGNWPLSRLAREITQARGFIVGQVVVNDRHYRGVIKAIYADDTADVRFDDGSTGNWPLSRLARETTSLQGFTVGQVVVNDRHYRGQITEIFGDGTANVRFADGSTGNWPLSRLSRETTSLGGFTVGQVVVNDRHQRGVITEIFQDQTANVRYEDGSTVTWPLSRLGRQVTSLRGFTVGQTITTDRNSVGVITEIFADQTANVRFYDGIINWPLSRLGPQISSLRGLSVGQRVATDTNRSGVIERIYWTEQAEVRFQEGVQTWPISRLSGAYCSPSVCPR